MDGLDVWIPLVGAGSFGAVVGWMTHLTLDSAREVSVKSLGAIIGVIGGGAVTAIFKNPLLFGSYCIGLGFAFFIRVVMAPVSRAVDDEMRAERDRADARRAARAAAKRGPPVD